MVSKLFLAAALVTTVAACAVDPTEYESTPVVVQTDAGPVVCQLYVKDRVLWDRATERPRSVDVETADNICRAEGERERSGM